MPHSKVIPFLIYINGTTSWWVWDENLGSFLIPSLQPAQFCWAELCCSALKHFTLPSRLFSLMLSPITFPFNRIKCSSSAWCYITQMPLPTHPMCFFSNLVCHYSASITETFQSLKHLKFNQALILTPVVASIYKDPPAMFHGSHLLILFGRKASQIKIIIESKIKSPIILIMDTHSLTFLSLYFFMVRIWNPIFAFKLIIYCFACYKF